MTVALILPTRNAGADFERWSEALAQQRLQPRQVLIIDSQSTDGTAEKARAKGFDVREIATQDFNHGGTRNWAMTQLQSDIDIAIFMTQDAYLHDENALATLVDAFAQADVAAAYGRQLPHTDANALAAHARLFNYPPESAHKSRADIPHLGIKTAFLSNAFAGYRVRVFRELGGFPDNIILGEDMYLAAKMILADYRIAYCAAAQAHHSHNYSAWAEARRYFDIGVFHQQAAWIGEQFGQAGGEGLRFVRSEWRYLWRHAPYALPRAFITTAGKWLGYQLGRRWQRLPKSWVRIFSMHRRYWDKR